MKKTIAIITLLGIGATTQAQDTFNPLQNKDTFGEMFRATAILVLIYLLCTFILSLIRLFLDNRLKKAIIDRGAPENVITQLMPKVTSDKKGAVKWFLLLTSVGIGLTIISFTQPIGSLASVIIMIFSIALGFLGYYFLLKRLND